MAETYAQLRQSLAFSNIDNADARTWFDDKGYKYFLKSTLTAKELSYRVSTLIGLTSQVKTKCFIVHGHDHDALNELRNYVSTDLSFDEAIVLSNMPTRGQTVIEKFERYAAEVCIVFVLMTPDDISPLSSTNVEIRRARQNVIFELGYFYGRFTRFEGKVVLLHKGVIEFPSDVSGILGIDISQGIANADAEIRREISDFLHRY